MEIKVKENYKITETHFTISDVSGDTHERYRISRYEGGHYYKLSFLKRKSLAEIYGVMVEEYANTPKECYDYAEKHFRKYYETFNKEYKCIECGELHTSRKWWRAGDDKPLCRQGCYRGHMGFDVLG